jgi:hypothetical protein
VDFPIQHGDFPLFFLCLPGRVPAKKKRGFRQRRETRNVVLYGHPIPWESKDISHFGYIKIPMDDHSPILMWNPTFNHGTCGYFYSKH